MWPSAEGCFFKRNDALGPQKGGRTFWGQLVTPFGWMGYSIGVRAILLLLRRTLFPHQGGILTLALWISVIGVILGIVQLMVVLSVFSGFQTLLQNNYTRITSEFVVIPSRDQAHDPSFRQELEAIDGIEATTPFFLGQGMIIKKGRVGGAVIEGIDLDSTSDVTPWKEVWVQGPDWKLQKSQPHWMWLGVQLAKKLDVSVGDKVKVLLARGKAKEIIPFHITAITRFGIYDHDLRYARVDLGVLKEIYLQKGVEPLYKCLVAAGTDLEDLQRRAHDHFGYGVTLKPWSAINRNVFLAVQHQKQMLFLILEIIVALASINVVNLLIMNSQHRKRDMAILRAMGLRFQSVFFYFVAQGALIGAVGIVVGVGLGLVVCKLAKYLTPSILSEAVYNVTTLPIEVRVTDMVVICVAAFVLCVAFSVLPALKAAWDRPVKALRYE